MGDSGYCEGMSEHGIDVTESCQYDSMVLGVSLPQQLQVNGSSPQSRYSNGNCSDIKADLASSDVYEKGAVAASSSSCDATANSANGPNMTLSNGIKPNLVHSNGHVRSTRGDVKHHVTFSDERIVTEVMTNSDERQHDVSDASHVSVLQLDQDGHPDYDITESVIETVTETQYREIPVMTSSPAAATTTSGETEPLLSLDTSMTESFDSSASTYSDGERTVRKQLVFTGPVIRLKRWPRYAHVPYPFSS